MSHYVISDLHGERERFHRMLELIDLKWEDTLYVLGDVVDRGEDPIGLLMEILDSINMELLLGNHEYMLLQCYSENATEVDWRRWNRNNNQPTKDGLARLDEQTRAALLARLRELPVHQLVHVNGKDFYLVHGFPGGSVRDEVWNRPEPDTPAPIPGVQVILGHTPVSCLGRTDEEEEAYLTQLTEKGEKLRIFHAPGYIDIDCGCGYDIAPKQMACYRLEDGMEFYV